MKKQKKLESLKENFDLFDSSKLIIGGGTSIPPTPTPVRPGTGASHFDWTPDSIKAPGGPNRL